MQSPEWFYWAQGRGQGVGWLPVQWGHVPGHEAGCLGKGYMPDLQGYW